MFNTADKSNDKDEEKDGKLEGALLNLISKTIGL